VPKQVSEFGGEDEEEKFFAWIFMGAPGPGASLHVSVYVGVWRDQYLMICTPS